MTPISKDDAERAMRVYLPLMNEADTRICVIKKATENAAGYPIGIVREICFLQLRVLCEIIAVGCLAVHSRTATPKKLHDIWEAGKLIVELEKLNPNCYPIPAELVREGNTTTIAGKAEQPHLSLGEMIKLWGRCGNALHRAPLSKITRSNTPRNYADIEEWSRKISALLSCHLIVLDTSRLLLVSIRDGVTLQPVASYFDFSLKDPVGAVSIWHFGPPPQATGRSAG